MHAPGTGEQTDGGADGRLARLRQQRRDAQ
jgi:hypothetical protein